MKNFHFFSKNEGDHGAGVGTNSNGINIAVAAGAKDGKTGTVGNDGNIVADASTNDETGTDKSVCVGLVIVNKKNE